MLAGCERGSLTHWLASRGLLDPGRVGALRLDEVDCPAGILRCVEGVVELAQASRHPDPCRGSAEMCACPWQVVGRCETDCVSDGTAILLTGPRAQDRLCAPGPLERLAAPPPPGMPAPAACGEELFRCMHSIVMGCNPPRVVASCLRGCAEEEETLVEEGVDDSAAVSFLCSR